MTSAQNPSEHGAGPSLTQSQGFWLAGLIASSYVASVYVSLILARPRPPLWRNDPAVIKARSLFATLSSVLCCFLVFFVACSRTGGSEDVREVFCIIIELLKPKICYGTILCNKKH